jgi:hypothetical protein
VNQYVCVSPRLSAVKFLLFVPFVVKICGNSVRRSFGNVFTGFADNIVI